MGILKMGDKMINKIKGLIDDYEKELISLRRVLHMMPECGFNLEKTYGVVFNKLKEYGYDPKKCGRSGIVAEAGKGKRCLLLRADMDALHIEEEADISYKATNGNMHACGHDMHTTMLLGCARTMKLLEDELDFKIRFMFQPAEEIFEGSKDMMAEGVLDDVVCALMMHVSSATPLKSGSVVIPNVGVSAPSCDFFEISVVGAGGHSGMPGAGNNPILPASKIVDELYKIDKEIFLSVCCIEAGTVANVIPNTATIKGTIRSYSNEERTNAKNKIDDLLLSISKEYGVSANVSYTNSCPTFIVDKKLKNKVKAILADVLKDNVVDITTFTKTGSGSEDFAYISNEVPTVLLSLSAGSIEEGYTYPLHHPKVRFNDDVLKIGSFVFSVIAYKLLEEN